MYSMYCMYCTIGIVRVRVLLEVRENVRIYVSSWRSCESEYVRSTGVKV